jgi:hypothetical protein
VPHYTIGHLFLASSLNISETIPETKMMAGKRLTFVARNAIKSMHRVCRAAHIKDQAPEVTVHVVIVFEKDDGLRPALHMLPYAVHQQAVPFQPLLRHKCE